MKRPTCKEKGCIDEVYGAKTICKKHYMLEYNKKYYVKNKEVIIAQTRKYYEDNIEDRKLQKREYRKNNKEYFNGLANKWHKDNRDIHLIKMNTYYKNNSAELNKKSYQKKKIRLQNDIEFYLKELSSVRIREALKYSNSKKGTKTEELIGCTIDILKNHLEKQFLSGISWENHGTNGWHIDHIVPCDSFDLSKIEEQKKCFHYTNLRPYWALDNIRKSCKMNYISDSETENLMTLFN